MMVHDNISNPNTRDSVTALAQDRYSLRCLPQFLGPMIESLHEIARTLEIEFNSASDNPLIDVSTRTIYREYSETFQSSHSFITIYVIASKATPIDNTIFAFLLTEIHSIHA